jgi:hypothetical protein
VLWCHLGYTGRATLHEDNRWSHDRGTIWSAEQVTRALLEIADPTTLPKISDQGPTAQPPDQTRHSHAEHAAHQSRIDAYQ